VHDLHFGLHESPGMPIAAAQRRSTELLWRHLPPACRLLEAGIGFGANLARLVGAGYAATGISPDPLRVRLARERHGETLPARCVRFEAFDDHRGDWDALLFRESAQHIDALQLVARADELLREQGEIIVLDEFALRRTAPRGERLHLLEHFVALAERFGFVLAERLDLSREAAPTLDTLRRIIPRHAQALQRDLGVTADALDGLCASILERSGHYAEGRCGYFLLRLRRASRPRWRIGRIDGGNSGAMRTLFAQVFDRPMSEAHWQWKYAQGRGTAIGVWEDERLIAHYGGVARDIVFFGQPQSAAQSCDVMVAPSGRATLSRHGPLFLAAATYLEDQLGYGNPHLLGFGFPNLRAWEAPARRGLYGGPVGRMLELSWPANRGTPSPIVAVRALDLTRKRDRADADACWSAMRADLKDMIVGVRDAEALLHRYVAHPDKAYRIFVVRRRLGGRPLGLMVLNAEAEGGCELLDLVAPLAAVPRLVAQARRVAASLGASRLYCWAVDNIHQRFGGDPSVRDLDVPVPANAWTAGPPIEGLVGKWWLTGGDTDFH